MPIEMTRRFYTLDVFAAQPLAGNPLAVVLDAQGLDGPRMQAIAREFNLSETVFVATPADPKHRASVRIFTPGREIPFAGHPTVGTAVLLAMLDTHSPSDLVLEEQIGPVSCRVQVSSPDHGHATFTLPRLPERIGPLPDSATLARALGVEAQDIGFGTHKPAIYSAGNAFRCVPLRSRDAVIRARPQGARTSPAPSMHRPTASPTPSSTAPNPSIPPTPSTLGCSRPSWVCLRPGDRVRGRGVRRRVRGLRNAIRRST
jgi:trans-2,3-dihydro-3-hydroxyanthranilate isomerase